MNQQPRKSLTNKEQQPSALHQKCQREQEPFIINTHWQYVLHLMMDQPTMNWINIENKSYNDSTKQSMALSHFFTYNIKITGVPWGLWYLNIWIWAQEYSIGHCRHWIMGTVESIMDVTSFYYYQHHATRSVAGQWVHLLQQQHDIELLWGQACLDQECPLCFTRIKWHGYHE